MLVGGGELPDDTGEGDRQGRDETVAAVVALAAGQLRERPGRSVPAGGGDQAVGEYPPIALRHFIDPTDISFAQATGWVQSGAVPVQNPAQQGAKLAGVERKRPSGPLQNQGTFPLG